MTRRDTYRLLVDAGKKFVEDKATRLAAALAYYTALSLSPLLVVVVAIVGWAFGAEAARGELRGRLRDTFGDAGAEAVEGTIASSAASGSGTIAAVVGIAVLVVGASGVFAQLQDALNAVWKVPTDDAKRGPSGVWALIRERLMSFSLVCVLAFLLLVSLLVGAAVTAVGGVVEGWMPEWVAVVGAVNAAVSFGLTAALFALIFKVLPDVRLAWGDVWLGAAVTAGLFVLGKHLIGLYLGRSALGSTFGAAGAFAAMLVWIYYSSLLVLFGAELTYLYAERFGSGVTAWGGARHGKEPKE